MDKKEIATVVDRITSTQSKDANPRTKAIVDRIISDLFQTIDDFDVSQDEFWSAINYLTELGKANEYGLLAPGLGFEHYFDLRLDAAEKAAGLDKSGTPRTIEGPLYVAGAPTYQDEARLDDGTDTNSEVLIMSGQIRDTNGTPLPAAKVEVWHANSVGMYSHFDSSQSPFNLRGTILTNKEGRYRFRSIMPVGYSCPPDSKTQQLLNQLGRHGTRPAHIHLMVSADGYRTLTTQINIADDPYLNDDFAFATRDGLVPEIKRVTDAAQMAKENLNRSFAKIDFDMLLVKANATLPKETVARDRAES